MKLQSNRYSRTWIELFLETRPFTQQETAFVMRHLPNPPYAKVLDVCCGQGRISNVLAQAGYEVVGIDVDETAVSIAQQNAPPSATYLLHDMRHLNTLPGTFDAITLLWQSFGYFDAATNEEILRQVGEKLEGNGRFILDIYNRAYWENNQGITHLTRKGTQIEAHNQMRQNWLHCRLIYGEGSTEETFEWQLYTLDEIVALAANCHLNLILSCVESSDTKSVSSQNPQMQLVFEKSRR